MTLTVEVLDAHCHAGFDLGGTGLIDACYHADFDVGGLGVTDDYCHASFDLGDLGVWILAPMLLQLELYLPSCLFSPMLTSNCLSPFTHRTQLHFQIFGLDIFRYFIINQYFNSVDVKKKMILFFQHFKNLLRLFKVAYYIFHQCIPDPSLSLCPSSLLPCPPPPPPILPSLLSLLSFLVCPLPLSLLLFHGHLALQHLTVKMLCPCVLDYSSEPNLSSLIFLGSFVTVTECANTDIQDDSLDVSTPFSSQNAPLCPRQHFSAFILTN